MYPEERVREMMRRTIVNLEFIEQHATANGPFEVTQLINSVVGAVAHPWEDLQPELLSMPLEEAERLGWPAIDRERASDREPETLGDLVRNLRNSLVHENIDLWASADGQIATLRIASYYDDRSVDPPRRRRAWGALVHVRDLRQFIDKFAELAESIYQARLSEPRKRAPLGAR